MKKTIITFIALMSLALSAAAQNKIAVVRFNEVFESYYKTKEVAKRFETNKKRLQEQLQEEQTALQQLGQEIQSLMQESQNDMFAEDAREEKRKAAEEKQMEFQHRRENAQMWQQQFQREFQKQRETIITDLREKVAGLAQEKGFDLVLDSSTYPDSPSLVVFSKDGMDITDSIVELVNKDAPQN